MHSTATRRPSAPACSSRSASSSPAQERATVSEKALNVAVVGCGNISGAYGETMSAYPSIRIAGATDVDRALSAAFVQRFGGIDYPSLNEILGDPSVDAIVNLTVPAAHADVTAAALNAGKHVHSEK